jgi:hypothetical protein
MKNLLTCGGGIALLFVGLGLSVAEDKPAADKANPNLAVIKKLAGEWLEVGKDGKPTTKVVSQLKVTAGGSAVREIIFPGTDMEMVTMYTQEGSDLILQHYCILGNQPRLKAERGGDGKKIVFKLVGGGNIDLAKGTHMGQTTLTIVDDDHITLECLKCENGKECDAHKMSLVRKK